MSWFGSSSQTDENQKIMSEEEFRGAKSLINADSGIKNSLLTMCDDKCVGKVHETDLILLNRTEARCIDKCIGKFFTALPKISEIVKQHHATKSGP